MSVLWNYTSFVFYVCVFSVQKNTQTETDMQIHTHKKNEDG